MLQFTKDRPFFFDFTGGAVSRAKNGKRSVSDGKYTNRSSHSILKFKEIERNSALIKENIDEESSSKSSIIETTNNKLNIKMPKGTKPTMYATEFNPYKNNAQNIKR